MDETSYEQQQLTPALETERLKDGRRRLADTLPEKRKLAAQTGKIPALVGMAFLLSGIVPLLLHMHHGENLGRVFEPAVYVSSILFLLMFGALLYAVLFARPSFRGMACLFFPNTLFAVITVVATVVKIIDTGKVEEDALIGMLVVILSVPAFLVAMYILAGAYVSSVVRLHNPACRVARAFGLVPAVGVCLAAFVYIVLLVITEFFGDSFMNEILRNVSNSNAGVILLASTSGLAIIIFVALNAISLSNDVDAAPESIKFKSRLVVYVGTALITFHGLLFMTSIMMIHLNTDYYPLSTTPSNRYLEEMFGILTIYTVCLAVLVISGSGLLSLVADRSFKSWKKKAENEMHRLALEIEARTSLDEKAD